MSPLGASTSGFCYSDLCGGESDPRIGDHDPLWGYGGGAPVSESTPSLESQQLLALKRPREVEQTAGLASTKEPTDRTVQIDGFSWTLPPDPGKKGPYPSLTFLIGAAISSSASGIMRPGEIRRWIEERYPSRLGSAYNSISSVLSRETEFVDIRVDGQSQGGWKLRSPQRLRHCYERSIFLKYRPFTALDRSLRSVPPAPEPESQRAVYPQPGLSLSGESGNAGTHFSPELLVKIGDHILTLPPYRAGQKRPPLRLLCGCAIALGPEQGAGMIEIAEWIADRYWVQDESAKKRLNRGVSGVLSTFCSNFRRTNTRVPRLSGARPGGMRWVLENPAGFAAAYKRYISI